MTKQKGICEECKVEYEYEYNPKYPRKYCPACSAAKKKAYLDSHDADGQPNPPETFPVEKVEAVNTAPNGSVENKHLTMYVSYAKDIFCALMIDDRNRTEDMLRRQMAIATTLVKQAKEAFS